MTVIGILNPKGGSGKSTLTTNLAVALYRAGKSVLIVDSDPQGTARSWYREQPEDWKGPDVTGMNPKEITRSLKGVGSSYDFVFIDGAAKIENREAGEVVKACDVIVIPVQPSPPDIWGARDLIDIIKSRQEITDGRPTAVFLVNRQNPRTVLSRTVEEALAAYEVPVFTARVSDREPFKTAMLEGTTVMDLDPAGKAAQEIDAITNELLELLTNGK